MGLIFFYLGEVQYSLAPYCILWWFLTQVTPEGISIEFDLLDRQPTDPPNVSNLHQATAVMRQLVQDQQLTVSKPPGPSILTMSAFVPALCQISISGQDYTAVGDSFEEVTTTKEEVPDLSFRYVVIIVTVGGLVAMVMVVLFITACYCCSKKYGAARKVAPTDTTVRKQRCIYKS